MIEAKEMQVRQAKSVQASQTPLSDSRLNKNQRNKNLLQQLQSANIDQGRASVRGSVNLSRAVSSTKNDLSINSNKQRDLKIRNTSKKINLIRKSHNNKNNNANTLEGRDDLSHVRFDSRLNNQSVPPPTTDQHVSQSLIMDNDNTFITNDFTDDYPPAQTEEDNLTKNIDDQDLVIQERQGGDSIKIHDHLFKSIETPDLYQEAGTPLITTN